MHDLRKKALLESGKTTSRKAKSKESTPPSSRPMSRQHSAVNSRVQSRAGSDDEGEFSDETEWSTASIDGLMADGDEDEDENAWIAALEDRINALVDRKRSSTEGREDMMRDLNILLTRHFAQSELKHKVSELLPVLLRSVKGGQSEREIVLATQALALLFITDPSESLYDEVQSTFKSTINDCPHAAAKTAAIHALAVATFYGGASVEETEEVMEYLLDIISSDGAVADAADDPNVVIAALEEWGFLATQLDDMEEMTEPAMDAFVEQLESSDLGVQIAAGENIALLYEKSYTEAEDDEEENDADELDGDGDRMVKRYTVYRQTHHLQQILEGLARSSARHISKKDRKDMHASFKDVLNTIEKPTRGPRYSTALDGDGYEYGSRMKVMIQGIKKLKIPGGSMTINKWWKLHRVNGLKRVLRNGFMVHYHFNQTVFDSLPVIVEARNDW